MQERATTLDPVAARRAGRVEELLAAAWQLAAEDGVGGFSLRALARRVGMSAPSVYEYFPSKDAIHDAMFAAGWRSYVAEMRAATPSPSGDLAADLTVRLHASLAACQRDLPRYQLLFTRVVPGWEPTPEAYAVAVWALGELTADLAELGITDPVHVELMLALAAGLAAQQAANDPDGVRTPALVPDAVAMYVGHVTRVTDA